MTRNKLILWLLMCLLVAGCSSSSRPDFFVKTEKIQQGYEYLGDIIVNKEGFYFLWFIPFASSSQEAAIEKMKKMAVIPKGFPDADGIFDLQLKSEQSVGIFNWAPNTVIVGKVVRKVH